MVAKIVGKTLTTVDVACDGGRIRMNMTDANDQEAALELPVECVNQLILTLPHAVKSALEIRYGRSSSRLVFPLGHWRLEQIVGDRRLNLTLCTPDGFEVSFAVESEEIERLQQTVADVTAAIPEPGAAN